MQVRWDSPWAQRAYYLHTRRSWRLLVLLGAAAMYLLVLFEPKGSTWQARHHHRHSHRRLSLRWGRDWSRGRDWGRGRGEGGGRAYEAAQGRGASEDERASGLVLEEAEAC